MERLDSAGTRALSASKAESAPRQLITNGLTSRVGCTANSSRVLRALFGTATRSDGFTSFDASPHGG
jgi:hypothetical protein